MKDVIIPMIFATLLALGLVLLVTWGRIRPQPVITEIVYRDRPVTKEIIKEVISRIPKSEGSITYAISQLEKIKKDFIQDAKNKIVSDIESLSEKAKRMLKYLESAGGVGVTVSDLCMKCFMMKSAEGGYNKEVNSLGSELIGILVARKQTNGRYSGILKERINQLMQGHNPTDQELENLYNHILMEMLSVKITV